MHSNGDNNHVRTGTTRRTITFRTFPLPNRGNYWDASKVLGIFIAHESYSDSSRQCKSIKNRFVIENVRSSFDEEKFRNNYSGFVCFSGSLSRDGEAWCVCNRCVAWATQVYRLQCGHKVPVVGLISTLFCAVYGRCWNINQSWICVRP